MSSHFYAHLVKTESLTIELDTLDLSKKEREELLEIFNKTVDHSVLDLILSNLEENDKKIFLENLSTKEHPKIWDHLTKRIEKIENSLFQEIELIKKDFIKDIKEIKKNR